MSTSEGSLKAIEAVVRDRFESEKRVLSMDEYIQLFQTHPWRHSRDAARYLRDAFDHFGTRVVQGLGGEAQRYRLFDQEFLRNNDDADGHDFLLGQEELQHEFYRIISNFVREGRINRLVLLHGPNGSAKSTFVSCLVRALEHFSEIDDGALYRFSWIFPRGRDGKAVGFGSRDSRPAPNGTYAHLSDEDIDVRLTSELRENPLLVLPRRERAQLVREAYRHAKLEHAPPRSLLEGMLTHKNREIYEALLTAYRGDLAKVLAHVRVERYTISRRYRSGAVTIGPEMAVDARERQISVDRSLAALPASLSTLTLFEATGALVDASGGILEFSDLLKRPIDAWRYLLLAIENGTVSLDHSIVPLNTVLIATSNELHLKAFREHHEYRSFRGRLQMVRVPYLRNYRQEQAIYDSQIVPQVKRHVSPHATYVAALWSVLTRLRKPQHGSFTEKLASIATQLSPIEKAELYADGTVPRRLSIEERTELKAGILEIVQESSTWPIYEGLSGASPREIRDLLLDAAQDPEFACLSPLAVLKHLDSLCDGSDLDFLKEKGEDGYHEHRLFIEVVRDRWRDRVHDEFRNATGLVEETQYVELFKRYVTHVSYWVKNERLYNPITNDYEEPDPNLMTSVEEMLKVKEGEADDYRKNLISIVAGHAISNPGAEVDYAVVFPKHFEEVREATYQKLRKQLGEIARDTLALASDNQALLDELDEDRRKAAQYTLDALGSRYGYNLTSARDAIGELLEHRYTAEQS